MKKVSLFYLFMLIGCSLITACTNNEKATGVTAAAPKKVVIMEPFRYHKLIEVSPGQDYDVLSWGRGSSSKGSFEILHSDSAANKYTTTTGDLDGAIVDVYNSDMDMDGNPEILIQAKGRDTINYTNIYAFEFNNARAEKLSFPKLTRSQKQGYNGDDNFYIEDGKLMREFPIYNGSGKDARPTGQKRLFQYGLRNNSFTVKQLSKDTTGIKPVKTIVKPAKEPVKISRKGSKTSKKTKRHTEEKKHKKHRKHHHSD